MSSQQSSLYIPVFPTSISLNDPNIWCVSVIMFEMSHPCLLIYKVDEKKDEIHGFCSMSSEALPDGGTVPLVHWEFMKFCSHMDGYGRVKAPYGRSRCLGVPAKEECDFYIKADASFGKRMVMKAVRPFNDFCDNLIRELSQPYGNRFTKGSVLSIKTEFINKRTIILPQSIHSSS